MAALSPGGGTVARSWARYPPPPRPGAWSPGGESRRLQPGWEAVQGAGPAPAPCQLATTQVHSLPEARSPRPGCAAGSTPGEPPASGVSGHPGSPVAGRGGSATQTLFCSGGPVFSGSLRNVQSALSMGPQRDTRLCNTRPRLRFWGCSVFSGGPPSVLSGQVWAGLLGHMSRSPERAVGCEGTPGTPSSSQKIQTGLGATGSHTPAHTLPPQCTCTEGLACLMLGSGHRTHCWATGTFSLAPELSNGSW